MLSKQQMLSNYNNAISTGAFVYTDTITLLIAIKEQNFNKALKHFNSKDILLVSIVQTLSKLDQYGMQLTLSETLKVKTRAFKRDRSFEVVLKTFLGDEVNIKTVKQLHDLLDARMLSFASKIY